MPIVRELVREDVDALLFAPDDPDDLARQVLRLLEDPALSACLAESAAAHVRPVHLARGARSCSKSMEIACLTCPMSTNR